MTAYKSLDNVATNGYWLCPKAVLLRWRNSDDTITKGEGKAPMIKGGQGKRPTTAVQIFRWLMFLVILIAVSPLVAHSKPTDCGTNGDVWEIKERDPVEEIQSAYGSKRDEIEAQITTIRDLKDYSPATKAVTLQRAERKRSFLVDTTYTLDTDIKDNSGKLIYPAGTRYNILDYPPFPTKKRYVVFNGENSAEIEYVISNFADDPLVTFITGGGMRGWSAAKKRIGTGVKMLTEDLARVFHLSKSISVISQDGSKLKVDEIPPPIAANRDDTKTEGATNGQ